VFNNHHDEPWPRVPAGPRRQRAGRGVNVRLVGRFRFGFRRIQGARRRRGQAGTTSFFFTFDRRQRRNFFVDPPPPPSPPPANPHIGFFFCPCGPRRATLGLDPRHPGPSSGGRLVDGRENFASRRPDPPRVATTPGRGGGGAGPGSIPPPSIRTTRRYRPAESGGGIKKRPARERGGYHEGQATRLTVPEDFATGIGRRLGLALPLFSACGRTGAESVQR